MPTALLVSLAPFGIECHEAGCQNGSSDLDGPVVEAEGLAQHGSPVNIGIFACIVLLTATAN